MKKGECHFTVLGVADFRRRFASTSTSYRRCEVSVVIDELARQRIDSRVATVSTSTSFADFLWTSDEAALAFRGALDRVVLIDSVIHPARIVLQRFDDVVRYWMTEDRRPESESPSEMGTVTSASVAVTMASDFVAGGRIALVQSERIVVRRAWT